LFFFSTRAGIDPAKSNIFVQSHVSAHAELTWLLNCITPMNWLERMIQYKDKAKKQQQQQGEAGGGVGGVGVGLFDYPVLMAADILLYQATHVPVGEDQRQHLELARDICRRFHDLFGKGNAFRKRCKRAGIAARPVFVEPSAMIVKEGGARIMSLTDGTNKMSKSDPNDMSRINVLDPPDVIRNKIKRCKTDAVVGLEWNNPDRPEATNLLSIYAAVQPHRTRHDIENEVKDMTWGQFKPVLADAIIAHLQPIQDRYHQVRGDPEYLSQVLAQGAHAADAVASRTLRAARIAMGFSSPSAQ
jgi:tryptophanyl-tRNA synthetase